MGLRFWFVMVGVAYSLGSFANAATELIAHYNSNGMPICLESQDQKHTYMLTWHSPSIYTRELYVVDMRSIFGGSEFSKDCGGQILRMRSAQHDTYNFLSNNTKVSGRTIRTQDLDSGSFDGYRLPERVIKGLRQVKAGATVYLEDERPSSFVAANPGIKYDLNLNRFLTKSYGPAYSIDVLRQITLQNPRNREFRNAMLSSLRRPPAELAGIFQNVTFLVAPGYMEKKGFSVVEKIMNYMKGMGIASRPFNVNSLAGLEINAPAIASQVIEEIKQGKKVFVMGASKGGPELMAALSILYKNGSIDEFGRFLVSPGQPGRGQILGVVSASSTLFGSFLAEWLTSTPVSAFSIGMVSSEAKSSLLTIPAEGIVPGLRSQTPSHLNRLWENESRWLPRKIPYFDLMGLADMKREELLGFVKTIFEKLLDSSFFPVSAATDGFLEYPAMLMPLEWADTIYQVPFHASHTIFDGDYEGYSTKENDVDSTKKVLRSLFLVMGQKAREVCRLNLREQCSF